MSGAQTSPFLTTNELLAPMAAYDTHANQLLQQQERQQGIAANNTEVVARAASTLIDPSLYPTEEARAAAWPGIIKQLKANGYAPNAPETYPGLAHLQMTARLGTPSTTQQEWQANIAANKAYTAATGTPATAPASSGGAGPAAPAVPSYGGGPGNLPVPQEYMPYFQEASQRTGIPVDLLIAQARQESGFNPGATGGAGEIGIMQIHPKTAANPGFGMTGVQNPDALRDPRTNINFGADYLKARAGGADLSTPQGQAAALRAYNGGGDPNYVANVFRYVPPGGPAVATAGAPGSTTAGGPVIAGDSLASRGGLGGSGVVGASPKAVLAAVQADSRAGKYSGQPVVLSTGASNDPTDLASVEQQIREAQGGNAGKITVLGVGPAVEAKAPGTNAKLQALATSYGAQFVPLPADQMSPDGVHPTAQGYATLKAAIAPSQGAPGGVAARTGGVDVAGPGGAPNGPVAAPVPTSQPQAQVPQPPANRVMPGSPDGPPAPTPAAQSSAPAGGPQPPQLQPLNARGLTAQQQAQVDAVAGTGRMTVQQRMAAEQAFVNQNIQLQQKAFSDWIQVQQLQTSQGQLSVAQQNSALEAWKIAHPEAKVTQVGGEIITQDPRNGKEIAPRIQVGMDRPEAQAAAVVARLGPRIAAADAGTGPPVTPEERAEYATQVGIYRNPKVETDPITKALIHVNQRELPPGFPEPGGPGAAGGPQHITPGMSPAQQEVEKKLGENFADQDTKAYAGANNSLYALGQMNNASEILDKQGGSAWTATGPAANLRIATAQGVNTLGSLFGVAPTFDPAAIGSWEALNKQTKLMGFKIINAAFGASREAASVINNATSAVPSAENTYLGFRLVSSGIEQELQRERELYEFKADRVRGGEPLATAEADFNKTHPIDVYTSRAIANAVPDDIAGYLVAHPDTVKAFDGHFGPGTGEFILKGGRTGLGQAARGR